MYPAKGALCDPEISLWVHPGNNRVRSYKRRGPPAVMQLGPGARWAARLFRAIFMATALPAGWKLAMECADPVVGLRTRASTSHGSSGSSPGVEGKHPTVSQDSTCFRGAWVHSGSATLNDPKMHFANEETKFQRG